jgi:hypothetical protein
MKRRAFRRHVAGVPCGRSVRRARHRCDLRSPYRDLGKPLLAYLRRITADPEAVAVVVMPELVVRSADRLLHNHRALYLKRLLLFEPRVILASVPYQLV